MPKTGAWNIGKINIPDFNISENVFGTGKYASRYNPEGTRKVLEAAYPKLKTTTTTKDTATKDSGSSNNNDYYSNNLQRIIDSERRSNDSADESNEADLEAINNEYDSIMGRLGVLESLEYQQQPIIEQEIAQGYDTSKAGIEKISAETQANLESDAGEAQTTAKGALGQARQTYNELLSGASRFGGSAQEGYGELLGRATAQNMGATRTGLQTTLGKISGEMTRTNTFYKQKLLDLNNEKEIALQKAQLEHRTRLAEIESRRMDTRYAKANAKLNQLQSYRERVNAIKDAAEASRATLDEWKITRQDKLNQAAADNVANYKLDLSDINTIISTLYKNGTTLTPEQQASLYGSVGTNVNDDTFLNNIRGFNTENTKPNDNTLLNENDILGEE